MTADPAALLAARFASQGLTGPPARSPEAVVERLLAVQGQDPRGFRLALRARSEGFTAAEVDAALTERRSLLVAWLNRGTLHLVEPADYRWLHPLTTPQLATANARRLAQEGVAPDQAERGVAVVAEAVSGGPMTRDEDRAALDAAGVPTGGQALVHLLYGAAIAGHVVRGPLRHGEQCWVPARTWYGPAPDPLERPDALARLARRYLTGHGPATAVDLARWAGITLGDARRAVAAIADEVVPGPTAPDGSGPLLDLEGRVAPAGMAPARLLGSFDPLLHGWASRELVAGAHQVVLVRNGVFRPFALVDGRAVATWGLSDGRLSVRPFAPLRRAVSTALDRDAQEVLRYLGLPPAPAVFEDPV